MFARSSFSPIRLISPAVEFLAPDRCAACDGPVERAGLGWCDGCLSALPWLPAGRCSACGSPLGEGGQCQACQAVGHPWLAMESAVRYESPIREMIHRWKFGADATLSRPLGHLMTRLVQRRSGGGRPCVVPVPQAEPSWRHRGFSPAIQLANHIRTTLDAPLVHALERSHGAPAQVGLTARQRRRNVSRLFRPARLAERRLVGRPVVLVDDVVTTMATAAACATTLQRAGVLSITVVSLARARA